jgi:hypothetical protein
LTSQGSRTACPQRMVSSRRPATATLPPCEPTYRPEMAQRFHISREVMSTDLTVEGHQPARRRCQRSWSASHVHLSVQCEGNNYAKVGECRSEREEILCSGSFALVGQHRQHNSGEAADSDDRTSGVFSCGSSQRTQSGIAITTRRTIHNPWRAWGKAGSPSSGSCCSSCQGWTVLLRITLRRMLQRRRTRAKAWQHG